MGLGLGSGGVGLEDMNTSLAPALVSHGSGQSGDPGSASPDHVVLDISELGMGSSDLSSAGSATQRSLSSPTLLSPGVDMRGSESPDTMAARTLLLQESPRPPLAGAAAAAQQQPPKQQQPEEHAESDDTVVFHFDADDGGGASSGGDAAAPAAAAADSASAAEAAQKRLMQADAQSQPQPGETADRRRALDTLPFQALSRLTQLAAEPAQQQQQAGAHHSPLFRPAPLRSPVASSRGLDSLSASGAAAAVAAASARPRDNSVTSESSAASNYSPGSTPPSQPGSIPSSASLLGRSLTENNGGNNGGSAPSPHVYALDIGRSPAPLPSARAVELTPALGSSSLSVAAGGAGGQTPLLAGAGGGAKASPKRVTDREGGLNDAQARSGSNLSVVDTRAQASCIC